MPLFMCTLPSNPLLMSSLPSSLSPSFPPYHLKHAVRQHSQQGHKKDRDDELGENFIKGGSGHGADDGCGSHYQYQVLVEKSKTGKEEGKEGGMEGGSRDKRGARHRERNVVGLARTHGFSILSLISPPSLSPFLLPSLPPFRIVPLTQSRSGLSACG